MEREGNPALAVVKVGGSLYDLPDLGPRLWGWLEAVRSRRVVLVPGGGPAADVVRDLDRRHALGEEAAHWLALRVLTLNAHFLARLLPGAGVCVGADTPPGGPVAILDAHAFARIDEGRPGCLPHTWDATSDSVAARFAVVSGASELVLLKSMTVPAGLGWEEAGRLGLVDPMFARVMRQARSPLEVRAVNFREAPR